MPRVTVVMNSGADSRVPIAIPTTVPMRQVVDVIAGREDEAYDVVVEGAMPGL